VIVVLDRDDVLISGELGLVVPQVRHHRADPGADIAVAASIVAERHDRRRRAPTGHLALGDHAQAVQRADALGPWVKPAHQILAKVNRLNASVH